MVLPGPSGFASGDLQAVTPKLARDRICDIAAATARTGHFIDACHEFLREQKVRAYIHAHMIAHDRAPSPHSDLAPITLSSPPAAGYTDLLDGQGG